MALLNTPPTASRPRNCTEIPRGGSARGRCVRKRGARAVQRLYSLGPLHIAIPADAPLIDYFRFPPAAVNAPMSDRGALASFSVAERTRTYTLKLAMVLVQLSFPVSHSL